MSQFSSRFLWRYCCNGYAGFAAGGVSPAAGQSLATEGDCKSLRFLIADALTKIVNDFRHLLALMLVSIFALALVYVLYASNKNIGQIKEGLQAVVATLGGLVGSIIGYYFGESSARASSPPTGDGFSNLPPVQKEPPLPDDGSVSGIKPAPAPGASADLSVKDEAKGG